MTCVSSKMDFYAIIEQTERIFKISYGYNKIAVRLLNDQSNFHLMTLKLTKKILKKITIFKHNINLFEFPLFIYLFSYIDAIYQRSPVTQKRRIKMFEHSAKFEEIESNDEDRIRKMYSNRSLFITGGSGFLGKIFIEKLLR